MTRLDPARSTSSNKPEPAPLRCAEIESQVPLNQLRGLVAILDCNQLTELRNARRNGSNELGDVLDNMARADTRYKGIIILPAIIEKYYASNASSPELIEGHKQHWMAEHFSPRNIPEVSATFTASTLPAAHIADVLYIFLSSYWLLTLASKIAKKHTADTARRAAVEEFLTTLRVLGLPPDGLFAVAVLTTALAGNSPAIRALNLRAGTPKHLLNGAWDLTHWSILALQWVASRRTMIQPGLITRDQDAAALLHRVYRDAHGQIQFIYDSPKPDEETNQDAATLLRMLTNNYLTHFDVVDVLLPALARSQSNEKLDKAIQLFKHCDEQLGAAQTAPDARARVSLDFGESPWNGR